VSKTTFKLVKNSHIPWSFGDKSSKHRALWNLSLRVCLLPSGRREGVFFVFVSMVLRVRERMGERVEGFFHSSQNEEICGNLVGLMHFTKIPLCMHFILIYKIKYYINLFIIYNFKNI